MVAATALAGCAEPADQPREPFVRYVEGGAKPELIGDLAQVLRIKQLEGKVQLNRGFHNVTLVFAFYKDGKKVDLPQSEEGLFGSYESSGVIGYAVQMVDLDFLPLGDGKKGHCRLRAAFRMPDESTVSLEKDIPKSTIDLTRSSSFRFTELASTEREVPLLWLKTGREFPLNLKTMEQVMEKAKEGSLLCSVSPPMAHRLS
jgi:hypothetical protein